MKDHLWKIIGVVAVLSIGASIVYSNHVANQANEGITFSDNIKGAENPVVTLTKYSDFQCPACAQHASLVSEVLAQYPDTVALEYKHYPLISIHPHAIPAARAAEAAGQQGKFFEMHDQLFENQQIWSNSGSPLGFFEGYAEAIGLDMELYKRHMKASLIQNRVEDEFREARALGLTGTPAFFLNGERMQYQSYEDFVAQVEAALGVTEGEGQAEAPQPPAEPDIRFGL